jgi:predicted dehydrogenase
MKIKPIRVGVLGCANFAIRTMIPELHRHPQFTLVALASRARSKAEPLAAEYGCKAMDYDQLVASPELDAVYIPLPTGLHAEWVCRSLEAGKHVICEKSLGCNPAELARRCQLALMENFQFRFHSQHAAVKRLLADGVIGEIRCFRSSFGFPPFADGAANIRYRKELGGGALLDAGAYTIKATTFMLGFDCQVKAANLRMSSDCEVDLGGSIYLENGAGLVSETAFGFDNFYQCNYEIWGSKGKLTAKRAFTAAPGFEPELLIETPAGVENRKLSADNHFANMLTHFAKVAADGEYDAEYEQNLVQAKLLKETLECSTV